MIPSKTAGQRPGNGLMQAARADGVAPSGHQKESKQGRLTCLVFENLTEVANGAHT